jgi:hypothetical protein
MSWPSKQIRNVLRGLEQPPGYEPIGPIEPIPEYVGDLADAVEMSATYTAALGIVRKQCIENGLSENETEAYVLVWIKSIEKGVENA